MYLLNNEMKSLKFKELKIKLKELQVRYKYQVNQYLLPHYITLPTVIHLHLISLLALKSFHKL